jgi:OOP family OmpA-OmpF porin
LNKTKKIVLAVAALCASFSAVAQDAVINPSWYVQPSVNGMKPDNDAFGVDKKGYGGGLKFGKALNEQWDVQLGGTYARSKENGERYQQQSLGADALYMFSRKSFRPFILVGAGVERDKANLNTFGEFSVRQRRRGFPGRPERAHQLPGGHPQPARLPARRCLPA